jgi:trehalose 6-phosphate synthase
MKSMPGVWTGWAGGESKIGPFVHEGVRIRPVHLTRQDNEEFYNGMSNRTFWPLYHDAIRLPEFHRHWWESYVRVNQRFARAAIGASRPGDMVWVHDYHLQLVPAMIRKARPDLRIGFFLHIPFPPEELFEWLPWRTEVLAGILGSDVVGFQTQNAVYNFARLCRAYSDAEVAGSEITYQGRTIVARSFPISIDFDWFNIRAKAPETGGRVADLRQKIGPKRKILLAIDRLDYTKGLAHRLQAFEELLESREIEIDDCVLIQIATPSRDAVADYSALRDEVEKRVGRINGRFSQPGRVAVHYFRRNLTREELVAYYAAADVMLVTPLRDGMNLVAKEYVACRTDNSGVLVLSQFAGAARELTRALIVNPRDTDRLAATLLQSLRMKARDARMRMSMLRSRVKRHDVHEWCGQFLSVLKG